MQKRAQNNPEYRESLLKESVECFLLGDIDTGKKMLRHYINATIGFEELARMTDKSVKSLMRMLGPQGNPRASNLFDIISRLQKKEGLKLEIHTSH